MTALLFPGLGHIEAPAEPLRAERLPPPPGYWRLAVHKPCPRCGAKPGAWCVSFGGVDAGLGHRERT